MLAFPATTGDTTSGGQQGIVFSSAGKFDVDFDDRRNGGLFINNTGEDINVTSARFDIGITITDFMVNGETDIVLSALGAQNNVALGTGIFSSSNQITLNQTGVQGIITGTNDGFTWGQGETNAISMSIVNFQSLLAFTYRVDFIRLRIDGSDTPFAPTDATLNYPPARGFAYEDYNEVTMDSDGTWPNAIRPLLGSTADINIIGDRANSEGSGAFQIGSGGSQTIRRVDVGIPVSYTHLTLPTKRIV